MSEFTLTDEDIELLEREVEQWTKLLNLTVSPILFTASAAFVGIEVQPKLFGFILLVFSMMFMIYIVQEFPKTIRLLREKQGKTKRETILVRGVGSYFFSFKRMMSIIPYLFSGCS